MTEHARRAKELVSQMTLAEKMAQMKYDAPAIPRLGVPAYNWWNECLHGVARSGSATVFPQAIGMAASFNKPLMRRVAEAISDEARAKYNAYKTFGDTLIYQGLTYWSPNVNIYRDPRWGRGHETYGEDPVLTGEMAVSFVRGLQGDDPNVRKVDATLKHYAVHSGPEPLRHGFDARVSEKELWETYLSAFAYCVREAEPSAVMGAYNRVNGEACCASKTLLETCLRETMGFKGYVVSDCGAVADINRSHHVTETEAESAALAVKAGCDLNCGSAYAYLMSAYDQGLVGEEDITRAVERLFEARFRLGMFDEETPYDGIPYEVVSGDAHAALNREMARECVVLVKNDGILPLQSPRSVAVIGPNADDKSVLLGNYNGTPPRWTTILRGIQDAADCPVYYARGCHSFERSPNAWAEQPLREAILAARRADVVVMVMGLNPSMEGEEGDAYNGARGGDREDIELPEVQGALFRAIRAEGKPIVFVNVSGGCVALGEQAQTCAAVVQCFYPGAEGGNALADILFGKACPSGRLPLTFYKETGDLPPFEDYAMAGRTYRFFEGAPLYPFGHGLSYTRFCVRAALEKDVLRGGEDAVVRVTVENTGDMDGAETVMAFHSAKTRLPGDPIRDLAAFEKAFVKRGERAQLTLRVPAERLCRVDEHGNRVPVYGAHALEVAGQTLTFSIEERV